MESFHNTFLERVINIFKLLFIFLFYSCSLNDGVNATDDSFDLTQVSTYRIDVPEPSGLSLHVNGKSLWTVSDQTAKVYQISLDGQLLKTLSYQGEDLEGISQSLLDFSLWVAEERSREIVHLDSTGKELSRHFIPVDQGNVNSGLEGIAIHPGTGQNYVLNEKDPAVFLKLSANQSIDHSTTIDFVTDCSGLAFEPQGPFCWLVSDESKTVVKCDSTGTKLVSYKINVDKAEGIAVSVADSIIYIVSDSEQKLYLFQMK